MHGRWFPEGEHSRKCVALGWWRYAIGCAIHEIRLRKPRFILHLISRLLLPPSLAAPSMFTSLLYVHLTPVCSGSIKKWSLEGGWIVYDTPSSTKPSGGEGYTHHTLTPIYKGLAPKGDPVLGSEPYLMRGTRWGGGCAMATVRCRKA